MTPGNRNAIVEGMRKAAYVYDSKASCHDALGNFHESIAASKKAKEARTIAAMYENEAEGEL